MTHYPPHAPDAPHVAPDAVAAPDAPLLWILMPKWLTARARAVAPRTRARVSVRASMHSPHQWLTRGSKTKACARPEGWGAGPTREGDQPPSVGPECRPPGWPGSRVLCPLLAPAAAAPVVGGPRLAIPGESGAPWRAPGTQ